MQTLATVRLLRSPHQSRVADAVHHSAAGSNELTVNWTKWVLLWMEFSYRVFVLLTTLFPDRKKGYRLTTLITPSLVWPGNYPNGRSERLKFGTRGDDGGPEVTQWKAERRGHTNGLWFDSLVVERLCTS